MTREQTIKDVWVMGGAPFTSPRDRVIQFDAWLAKVRAEAWDEGLEFNARQWEDGSYEPPVNPYRAATHTENGENTHE